MMPLVRTAPEKGRANGYPTFMHYRPISVFKEMSLPPGEHHVHLKFWPVPGDGATWKPEIRRTVRIEAGVIELIRVDDDTAS